MPDTFDTDPDILPPLTKAIRATWPGATGATAAVGAVPNTRAIRAILDAVHSLENRVIDLETP
ncbi:hypothetical protein [Mycolicibacterium hippocampi]|uniref:Uncharacterized protein n=1 Tax=Mycolicibacterium hippocampi TaxID=659824 RepID=A0A7I9ZPL5_9MYCO|nr:hypothetical protein [Mycolicibacterium hippocampi]GFH02799.1 hypothetical protein MHIP_32820 [Mycolicibacterium hippocampi]